MSFRDEIDTDIDNYTEDELLNIVGLDGNATEDDISSRIDKIINKYTLENNKKYANFFIEAKEKLLAQEEDTDENTNNPITEQAETWYKNQYLESQNQNQNDKITRRHSTTQVFDRGAIPVMKQETLGVNNTIPLNIAQDSLNPVLRQIITRYITIDSKYRPNNIPFVSDPNAPSGTDTNFTLSLSESLRNVLSIQLSSLYIPSSWYTFDNYIGNTCFYVKWLPYVGTSTYPSDASWNSSDASCIQWCIPEGNYSTVEDLVNIINKNKNWGIGNTGPCSGDGNDVAIRDLSGLWLTIQNPTMTNQKVQFLNNTPFWLNIIFYDPNLNTGNCCSSEFNVRCTNPATYLQNIGYYLGYRIIEPNTEILNIIMPPYEALSTTPPTDSQRNTLLTLRTNFIKDLSNSCPCTPGDPASGYCWYTWFCPPLFGGDLSGVTQTIVSELLRPGKFFQFPDSYYQSTTAGQQVIGAAQTPVDLIGSEYFLLTLDDYTSNYPNNGLVSIGALSTKLDVPSYAIKLGQDFSSNICDLSSNKVSSEAPLNGYGPTQFVPTFPRKLTQAQLYSVNQIINNRQQNLLLQSPDPPDLFANINLTFDNRIGRSAITYNNTNTVYERKYFGPVTLQRLGVKLLDSKGNLVNLHGQSWSFTLAVQQLYQY